MSILWSQWPCGNFWFVTVWKRPALRYISSKWWHNFHFIPFIMPLFETGGCFLKVQMTVGKCLLFLYPVPIPLGYSGWSVSAQLKHIPSCQGFSSMFWSYLSARSQYSCPTAAENIKRAELLSPTTPFSHSTHGCMGFCAITERLCGTQKVPEWKTWSVRCRNMCQLKSHLQLCLAPLFFFLALISNFVVKVMFVSPDECFLLFLDP